MCRGASAATFQFTWRILYVLTLAMPLNNRIKENGSLGGMQFLRIRLDEI